jgi:hypothetical protein
VIPPQQVTPVASFRLQQRQEQGFCKFRPQGPPANYPSYSQKKSKFSSLTLT